RDSVRLCFCPTQRASIAFTGLSARSRAVIHGERAGESRSFIPLLSPLESRGPSYLDLAEPLAYGLGPCGRLHFPCSSVLRRIGMTPSVELLASYWTISVGLPHTDR